MALLIVSISKRNFLSDIFALLLFHHTSQLTQHITCDHASLMPIIAVEELGVLQFRVVWHRHTAPVKTVYAF